jgi:hypothetical protein
MPRPRLRLGLIGAVVLCAAVPPPALHAALAAAAGSVFEAAPFVLASEALGASPFGALAGLAGCGCSRRALPGALAPAALTLAWLAFGPPLALTRTAAAAVAALLARRAGPDGASRAARDAADPFDELARLGTSAALAALAVAGLGLLPPGSGRGATAFGAGLAVGALVPCAVAGVAVAAALAHAAPAAAAGVLAVAGIVPVPPGAALSTFLRARVPGDALGRIPDARPPISIARLGLSAGLAWLAARGPAGFVHPRLLPFLALGAVLALASARRPGRSPAAAVVPAGLLAALLLGSPPPPFAAGSALADGYAGERLAWTGVAHRLAAAGGREPTTAVVRSAMVCCRLDATPIAVRLDRALPVADGTWVTAAGTLARAADGTLVLAAPAWRRIPPPTDPFVYR